MPRRDPVDLPATLERSSEKAQDTFRATLREAIEEYGDGERARRTAYASLKHSFEKVGDHWEAKEVRGPSEEGPVRRSRGSADRPTHGGVDARASKEHLLGIARRLGVRGRSRMTKAELVDALEQESRRRTRASAR